MNQICNKKTVKIICKICVILTACIYRISILLENSDLNNHKSSKRKQIL